MPELTGYDGAGGGGTFVVKKTGSGFRGWLYDLNGLKEPHPNALIYAKMFDTFKKFIRDKPYLLNQIELYNISKQHQKKICSVWYT